MDELSNKIVKTRKEHKCHTCQRFFPAGTEMNRSVYVDGEIYSIYMCKTCLSIMHYCVEFFDFADFSDSIYEGDILGFIDCYYPDKTPEECLEILETEFN